MLRKRLGLVLLYSCLFLVSSIAQTPSSVQEANSVNVDNLSDAQISAYMQQAAASGYSMDQIEAMARARGVSSSQIAKFKTRMGDVDTDEPSTSNGVMTMTDPSDRTRYIPDGVDEKTSKEKEQELINGLPVFGMSFFTDSLLTFEPALNTPTPSNYLLGPGDQIYIDIWGASEQTYQLKITPEGNLVIPELGPVYLNGLTVEKAESKLKSRLKAIYSTLGDNTFAQMSLGQIRTIGVNVIGEVRRPGTYRLSSFGNTFNALYLAGGPSINGSFRQIVVFRGGKKVATLDAYKYLIYGEGENIDLQDQDVILVKPYGIRVGVSGQVKRPANYEMLEGETVETLLEFTGGFGMEAYTKSISLRRNEDNFKTIKTVYAGQFDQLTFKSGDFIEVGTISAKYRDRVRIEGAVNHPGQFQFTEGMMLSDLVSAADGFRGDAFQDQALIVRENGDFTLSNVAFSPAAVADGSFDMELQSEDLVKVKSIFDLRESYSLKIQGEVRSPGDFEYFEGMTVENLIYLAGGFTQGASKSFIEVARRIYEDPKGENYSSEIFNFPISASLKIDSEASDFELEPFDLVVVRTSPFFNSQKMVQVAGEVKFPGTYVIEKKNERISEVLARAGGLNKYAYAEGASLVRLSEYNENSEESRAEVTEVKKQKLTALYKRDTALRDNQLDFKERETIGIYLDEIIKNPGSRYDLILKEGDILNIPKQLETIKVRGKVLYPSTIHFDGTSSLSAYISRAGGFGDRAMKKRIYVIYANGTAKKTKSFLWFKDYPAVTAGAEVIVPEKPERIRMTPGEWMGIATSLGTLALVINTLVK